MKTWIVIAGYNEGSVVGSVIEKVRQTYPNVILVDDASNDNTGAAAKAAGAVVLQHLINRGQGAALKTGIVYALNHGAEAIVTFDADGQHDPKDIPALLAPIEAGTADITLGSRFLRDGSNVPPLRLIILQLGIIFTRFFSHIRVTDTHNGFRAMTAESAKKIRLVQDRMAHASEILDEITRFKLRYQEVPVTISYSYYSKEKGQSSWAMFKIAARFLIYKIRN